MIMDPALAQLLEEHKRYFSILPDGKVKCEINGHQFPPRLDVATAFIKGNKFAKLKKRYDAEHSLEKYEPFILQSANFPNMLYCALTGQLMDKSLDAVKKHIQGKRFQNKKARFAADQLELKDEPDIDTLLAEITGRSVGKKKKKGEEAEEGSGGGSEDGEGSEDEESGQSEGDEEGMSEDEEPVAGKGAKEASKPREGKQVKLTPAQTEAAPDAAQKGKQQKREKQGGKGADAGSSGLAGSKRKREKEAKGPGVGVVKEQQQVGKAKGIEKRLQQQQQQQQQYAREGGAPCHGVCLSMLGSKWSSPIILPFSGADRAASGGAGSMSEAALIRARSADGGTVHELVAHVGPAPVPSMLGSEPGAAAAGLGAAAGLEGAGNNLDLGLGGSSTGSQLLATGQSQQPMVLRLEAALVVVNRTGYDLSLLQPEAVQALSTKGPGGLSPETTGPLRARVSAAQVDCAVRVEAALSRTGALPPPPALMTVPAGAVGVPLHWHAASEGRLLCFALPSAEGMPLLSEPFRCGSLEPGEETHMLLPVSKVASPAPSTPSLPKAAASTAGGQAIPSAAAPSTQAQGAGGDAWAAACARTRRLLKGACRGCGAASAHTIEGDGSPKHVGEGQALHPCPHPFLMRASRPQATHAPKPGQQMPATAGVEAGEVVCVVVRVRLVARGTPGCWALVISSLGGQPPHLLHNATPAALLYHEASARIPWRALPPFSAHGFVRQHMMSLDAPTAAQDAAGTTAAKQGQQRQQGVKVEICSGQATSECLALDLCGEAAATATPLRLSAAPTASPAATSAAAAGAPGAAAAAAAAGSAGGAAMHLGGPEDHSLVAQLADTAELVMGAGGVVYVQGGGGTQNTAMGGAPRSERVLRLVPSLAWPGMATATAAGVAPVSRRSGAGSSSSSRRGGTWMLLPTTRVLTPDLAMGGVAASKHISVEVTGLEVSLVDHRPQELLVLSLEGLMLDWASGSSGGLAFSQFGATLRDLQVDDQLPDSPYPVVLMPSDEDARRGIKNGPLIVVQVVSESGRHRGCAYYPSVAVRVLPMHLALGEALMWRLVTAARLLSSATAPPATSANATAAAAHAHALSAAPGAQGTAAQAISELPLQIDVMNITDVDMKLSFKADAMSRPRIANQTLSLALDLANLRELPLALPGVELEGVRVQRAALQQMVVARLQQRLFGIAVSVLRSSGVFGSASKIFAAASHGVSALTDSSQATAARRSDVAHVGEGFSEGGRAFAQNMLRGATGVFTKPMEGAGKGIGGFLGGMAKGLVGAAASPIGGALAAASKVTEGMDAQYRMLYGTRQTNRKRLPRPFTGDRMLRPFSLHPALGQALLHGAVLPESVASAMTVGLSRRLLSRVVGTGNSAATTSNRSAAVFIGDAYEDHFLLPGDFVMLITTQRLILLEAPDFVALQLRVMSGELAHVTEVPGGVVVWELRYKSMLTAELAWHQQIPGVPPDGVLVHRKARSQRDGMLVYDVRCRPNSHQAQELLQAINATRRRFDKRSSQAAAELKSKQMLPAVSDAGQQLPETTLSVDFKPVWVALRRTAGGAQVVCCSIWRPIGPPGYAMLGDVAERGADRPYQPVRMYRDTAPTDNAEAEEEAHPRLAPPVGYALVFRDSAHPPVTLWRPVPPRGYTEVGCVAWPEMEEPPISLVRCVRSDLAATARVYEAPLWQGISSDNQFWVGSIWLVDSPLSTFLANKSSSRPPAMPRVPRY
uniref:Vacuolar protein sorting-associated protein 13 VPS13 adaptor binding domain-containing protein n=1 Tax=Dunaliella tertiolecta TaxID=3047 RepID=A0A7S3R138_DUNTE